MSQRSYGLGGGLASVGMGQQRQAADLLGDAAEKEQQREIFNRQQEQERKAGNAQLGSSLGGLAGAAAGAQYGSAGGVYGMAIGAVVGAIAGGLF